MVRAMCHLPAALLAEHVTPRERQRETIPARKDLLGAVGRLGPGCRMPFSYTDDLARLEVNLGTVPGRFRPADKQR